MKIVTLTQFPILYFFLLLFKKKSALVIFKFKLHALFTNLEETGQ